MTKIVVISDTHLTPAAPDISTWEKFAKWCVKYQPDVIIHLGDVADFQSCVAADAPDSHGNYELPQQPCHQGNRTPDGCADCGAFWFRDL